MSMHHYTHRLTPVDHTRHRKALIIGGGIGGLATAIALTQIGFTVEVFERVTLLREVGAGLSLWANAIKALDYLGLASAVRALALPEAAGGIRTPSGALLMQTANDQLAAQFGELSVMVHRAELHDLLRQAFGQEIHLGMACVAVTEEGQGVRVRFRNGEEALGDLVIGADGLHSQARAGLHGVQPPRYAGYTAWRGVVGFDISRLQVGETWGAGARFGQIPMQGNRVYWFATQNAPAGQHSPDGEKAELLRLFGNWHNPIRALIEATPDAAILRNDIYDRPPLKRWGRGRITLLGDAAHPMTPNLGQGACQALEDAVVLAKQVQATADIPTALRAYEAARIPRTTMIVNQSRQVGQVGQWANPVAVAGRNWLVKHLLARVQYRQFAPLIGYEL
jgi:2-polyprenyl-6-methoxyphenol hydroxylase-like FAD-dependent oxidoreductase